MQPLTRINNADGGFGLVLDAEERFSRSISFVGDLRGDGTMAVNYGGGAGGTGTLYLLFLKPCDINQLAGFNRWAGGTTLFSNWSNANQALTSDSLTLEQCTFKAFETDAPHMTYNFNDGRCICKDSSASLAVSTELSTAFYNECFSGFVPTQLADQEAGNQAMVYPNPTQSHLVVKTAQTSFTHQDRIEVYTAVGQQLYTAQVDAQYKEVDLSAFPEGIYLLVVTLHGVPEVFKIVKDYN